MPQTYYVGSRSPFVTLVAWAFIVVAALASASALVQSAQVASVMPQWQALATATLPAAMPAVTAFLLKYLPWLMGAGFVVSLALLACAVGLLMRLEWARRTAIGLLGLAIAANLGGLWLQHEVLHALVSATLSGAALPQAAAGMFGGFATATQVMGMLVTLACCVGLGWLIRRLMSDVIRQEFA
jgi:hypothetical protein